MSPLLDARAVSAHRLQNRLHSAALLAGLAAIVAVASVMLLGWVGLSWAAITVGLIVILLPRIPPEMLMRAYRAQPLDPRQGSQLTSLMAQIAARAGLPRAPDLYVIPSMTLNAFATGEPGRAVVGVTEGLLRRLTLREIAGVLAHEISHVRNNDLGVMSIADVLTRLTQGLAYVAVLLAAMNILAWFSGEEAAPWPAVLFLYLAPTMSSLLQLALSRTREFDADLEGASLTGDPLGLASALRRLEQYSGELWEDLLPSGRRIPYPSILRSHPSTDERVGRLIELSARPPAFPPFVLVETPMISLAGVGPASMRPRLRFPGFWY